MTKEIACSACGFRIRADTDNELVTHFTQHSKEMHHDEPTRDQVLAMAKTVQVAAV